MRCEQQGEPNHGDLFIRELALHGYVPHGGLAKVQPGAASNRLPQRCNGLRSLSLAGGNTAALPISDTLKEAGPDARIAATVERAGLWRAQTPQEFRTACILPLD